MKVLIITAIIILIAAITVLWVSIKGALEIRNALDELLKHEEGRK